MSIVIRREPWNSPLGRRLVAELDADLEDRYRAYAEVEGEPDRAELNILSDSVAPPNGVFLVAEVDGVPSGCGAVRRRTAEEAEVKRMYVAPAARGRGVGRRLLAELEREAAALGYRRLVLETGTGQPEAMALYESCGWTPIPAYGAYRHSPLSRCYEKLLEADAAAGA